jgi:hypothetical protein
MSWVAHGHISAAALSRAKSLHTGTCAELLAPANLVARPLLQLRAWFKGFVFMSPPGQYLPIGQGEHCPLASIPNPVLQSDPEAAAAAAEVHGPIFLQTTYTQGTPFSYTSLRCPAGAGSGGDGAAATACAAAQSAFHGFG